ncbi:MAG: hypothetical protein P1Q69_16490 [Candidatus Thorarchaeota archaeon]|nr:hypothetical protein [Candidatus Thorarchaeota archaeon]
MKLVEAILKANESAALDALKDMLPRAQPSATWAILTHAAAWHEQRTYDTPHSTILTFAIHRMIEELGPHSKILTEDTKSTPFPVPSDLKKHLQLVLIQRLVQYLTAVDHWVTEKGPRYYVKSGVDSPGNLLRKFTQSIREKSMIGAMEAGIGLSSMGEAIRLTRMAASMAAEQPDTLGHGFIMPISLLAEIPEAKYTNPTNAVLWHLMEYMIRKIPGKSPPKFVSDDQFKRPADPTDLTPHANLISTAVVEYGTLGHNGIFAHRIAYASEKGLIHDKTVNWLLDALKKNIRGEILKKTHLKTKNLIAERKGSDWESVPSAITLPSSENVHNWLSENFSEAWNAMRDLKSSTFEGMIPSLKKDDYNLVRAAQYALCSLYGRPNSSHIMIYTQGVWGFVDMGLISQDVAALQVHRMVREYLKGR